MECNKCPLHSKCDVQLGGKRISDRKPSIMFIADYPTNFEHKYENSFSGDHLLKIRYFFEKVGIDIRDVYFTYAIKCRVANKGQVKNKHINACRNEHLFSEISSIKPRLIIASGKLAYQAVTDNTAVADFRGYFDNFKLDVELKSGTVNTLSIPVLPTLSVDTSCFVWEMNNPILRDLKTASNFLKNGSLPPVTKTPKINFIHTREGLIKFYKDYMKHVGNVFTDTETSGLDFWRHEIINIGFCKEKDVADILYINEYPKEYLKKFLEDKKYTKDDYKLALLINRFVKENRKLIYQIVRRIHANKKLRFILQNAKFDMKMVRSADLPYHDVYSDSMLGDALLDENEYHNLMSVYERYGVNYGPYDTKLWPYVGKIKQKPYWNVPPRILIKYLGFDVCGLYRAHPVIIKKLKEENLYEYFMNQKMRAMKVVCKSEYKGAKIDKKFLLSISRAINKVIVSAKKEIEKITGKEGFNPESTTQMKEYMMNNNFPFEKCKIKKTANGGYQCNNKTLLAFQKIKKHEKFCTLVLEYKRYTKVKGTYIDGKDGISGMLQHLDKFNRVHTSYGIHSLVTGRYGANSPSVQVWPRPVKNMPNTRRMIIAGKGNLLFEFDYSQLEINIVAVESKDRVLIDKIQKGVDLHCFNTIELGRRLKTISEKITYEYIMCAVGKKGDLSQADLKKINFDINSMTKEEIADLIEKRSRSKTVGFGLNYGKEAKSFADEFKISISEAEDMIDAYFDLYCDMAKWRKEIQKKAIEVGYIKLASGRKRRFTPATDWIKSKHGKNAWSANIIKQEIQRQALNYPVQGGAHDVFEKAIIRIDNQFIKEKIDAYLLLLIHDGVVGECKEKDAKRVLEILKKELPETFLKGTKLEITLKADLGLFKREWYGEYIE